MHEVSEMDAAASEELRRVTVNIPDDLYERLAAKALAEDRTVSSYLRALLRRELEVKAA